MSWSCSHATVRLQKPLLWYVWRWWWVCRGTELKVTSNCENYLIWKNHRGCVSTADGTRDTGWHGTWDMGQTKDPAAVCLSMVVVGVIYRNNVVVVDDDMPFLLPQFQVLLWYGGCRSSSRSSECEGFVILNHIIIIISILRATLLWYKHQIMCNIVIITQTGWNIWQPILICSWKIYKHLHSQWLFVNVSKCEQQIFPTIYFLISRSINPLGHIKHFNSSIWNGNWSQFLCIDFFHITNHL